jgi:hypothetical protein
VLLIFVNFVKVATMFAFPLQLRLTMGLKPLCFRGSIISSLIHPPLRLPKRIPMPPAFAWYLALTPNQMFSDFYSYPLPGKTGLPLCQEHGRWLKLKEAVMYHEEATGISPPDYVGFARSSCDDNSLILLRFRI